LHCATFEDEIMPEYLCGNIYLEIMNNNLRTQIGTHFFKLTL